MSENSQHTISVGALMVVLCGLVIVSLISGVLAANFIVKRELNKFSPGSKVIETVQTMSRVNSSFAKAVESAGRNTLGVLDDAKNIKSSAVVLTADGVVVAPNSDGSTKSINVALEDGTVVNARFVRLYPEIELAFYRINGSFTTLPFASDGDILTGEEGIAARIIGNASKIGVQRDFIEYLLPEGTTIKNVFVGKQAKLEKEFSGQYLGAPFYGADGELLGIIIDPTKGTMISASEIDFLLQDYLKHSSEEKVSVMNGIEGVWTTSVNESGKTDVVFSISSVVPRSVMSQAGVQNNDLIYSINDKVFPEAQMWETFLESARTNKPAILEIRRGIETLKILVTTSITNDASN
jgi:S1-C subfamily serine protease